MRWLPLIAVVVAASSARAATASDPAFLGVGQTNGDGYCSVKNVTPESPAQDAGVAFGDEIYALDGVPVGGPRNGPLPCDNLTDFIVARRPGDEIRLDVRRGGQRLSIKATLSSRGEVLARRFVGARMMRTTLEDLDDSKRSYDLGDVRGPTTIVGWFMLDSCSGCSRVFDRIADRLRARFSDGRFVLLAATAPAKRATLMSVRKSFAASVSVAIADDDAFDALALRDSLRISFMVIDCRGVVRFVAPIAPEADDLDAAVDDILAAVEQAEYQRNRRN